MKLYGTILTLAAVLAVGFTVGMKVHAGMDSASKPGFLTELEKNILVRTELQLQDLQKRFQDQAKPIIDEQQRILKRKCGEVKAAPGVDCDVNVQSGVVGKKAPAPPQTSAIPAPTPGGK